MLSYRFDFSCFITVIVINMLLVNYSKQLIQHQGTFTNIIDRKNPFSGLKVTKGYLHLKANKSAMMYYVYVQNKQNLTTAPLVIIEPGGPGVSSLALLMHGLGFWTKNLDEDGGEYYENEYSLGNFADFLVIETPTGVGCSYSMGSDNEVDKIEQIIANKVEFLNQIEEEKKLNIKGKDIYLYGISYSAITLTAAGLEFVNNGYKIKGQILDSPYSNPYSAQKYLMWNLRKNGTVSWFREAFYDFLGVFASFGLELDIYGSKAYSEILINSSLPITQMTGDEFINSPMDVRPDTYDSFIRLWKSIEEFFNPDLMHNVFECKQKFKIVNEKISSSVFLNNMETNYDENIGKFIDNNIPLMVIIGKYDYPFGNKATQDWFQQIQQIQALNFDDLDWVDTDYGKKKYSKGKILFHKVSDSGHSVWTHNPKIAYTQQKEFMDSVQNGTF